MLRRREIQSPRGKKGDLSLACEDGCEGLGRSRGGFGSKLHLAFEGEGRPLGITVTEGQRHESTQLENVLDTIRVPRRRGRPRKRPDELTLDKAFSSTKCRAILRRRGIRHVIPERRNEQEHRRRKGSRGGRPNRFDKAIYRLRSWAERGVNRLKQWRRVATRYEKRGANYLALVQIAAIIIWLK